MYVGGSGRLLILSWILLSQSKTSLSQRCEVHRRSGGFKSELIILDCENESKFHAAMESGLTSKSGVDLMITNNQIKTIGKNNLPENAIRILEIRDNMGLTSIHSSLFLSQPGLQRISIFERSLALNEIIFKNPSFISEIQLSVKELSDNYLNNLPDSLNSLLITKTRLGQEHEVIITKNYFHLRNITISECSVKSIVFKHQLRYVVYLDLSVNQLEHWQNVTFATLPSLEYLNLQDNKFLYFDINVLGDIKGLQELILNGNYISNISTDIFRTLKSLRYIRNSYSRDEDSTEVYLRTNFSVDQVERIHLSRNTTKMYLFTGLGMLLGGSISLIYITLCGMKNSSLSTGCKNRFNSCLNASNTGAEKKSEHNYSLPDPDYYDVILDAEAVTNCDDSTDVKSEQQESGMNNVSIALP